MTRKLDKATMLALAALYEITEQATASPFHAPLELRAILSMLYQRSDRQREPYAAFWRTMMEEGGGVNPAYSRSTHARTHWLCIGRSLGANPETMAFQSRIVGLIREHDQRRLTEHRARALLIEEVGRADLTREIIATKGRPHSAEARGLIAERRAAGLMPDGSKVSR